MACKTKKLKEGWQKREEQPGANQGYGVLQKLLVLFPH
jgi:hypothetical protein